MVKFVETFEKHFGKLESFVPVVAKVHGGTHPEFYEVKRIYEVIRDKVKDNNSKEYDLESNFSELRKATNNYTVPEDTCVTYEAVYNMLKEIDEAYNFGK